ncbi:isoprenylcysteine carboxylmethyltransferase family protein [Desertihabitans brevis]|uniref:Isoprenylcysteine carboxylmethyltransferase family protein n=2 Tax=Desertihabitans brevis TaxID=2268447 RepID=A0A367YZA9_9ACTN|nr:isoprenylcysteine carboxylmethyltransferase family protein [Desertihabitans brevis]
MVLVWFLALVALPAVLRRLERAAGIGRVRVPGGRVLGGGLLLAASALGIRSAVAMAGGGGTPVPFDAAARLVADGPYRWVRNPMAVSGVAQALGVALAVGSPSYLLVPPVGAVAWHRLVRPSEERFLRSCFGEQFEDYRAAVPLWLPHALRPRARTRPRPGSRRAGLARRQPPVH